MVTALRHVGLGDRMVGWILSVYSNPTAQIKANGLLSELLPISNGTRTRVSSFTPSLRPLTRAISLQGQTKPRHLWLFSHTNPVISLPNLLSKLYQYRFLLQFKNNLSKSEAMGVSMSTFQIDILRVNFNFKWSTLALKYLSTYIPP